MDLFMPKDSNFQNKVMDLTVEENWFLYYPFVYPDPDHYVDGLSDLESGQKQKRANKKNKK